MKNVNNFLSLIALPLMILSIPGLCANGDIKWTLTTGGPIVSSPAIGHDGIVYVSSTDSKLYALRPNGFIKWIYTTSGEIHSSPAIGLDGTIYFGSNDNYLYAINPDGTRKWRFVTGGDIVASPAIGVDGVIYIGSKNGKLYAINPDGSLKWSINTPDGSSIISSASIGHNGSIYYVSELGHMQNINPDGSVEWSVVNSLSDQPLHASIAIGNAGNLYLNTIFTNVGGGGGLPFVVIISSYTLNGTYRWDYSIEGLGQNASPVVNGNNNIISSGIMESILLDSPGNIVWDLGFNYDESTPAIDSNNNIYFGTASYLYALNSDGTTMWNTTLGGVIRSSPNIANDGTLYVGADNGKMYAIKTGSTGLNKNSWSSFGGNQKNTRNVKNPLKIDILDLQCINSNSICTGINLKDYGVSGIHPDPNPNVLLNSPNLPRTGIVADGATKVLLKVESEFPITFEIRYDGNNIPSEQEYCSFGTLMSRIDLGTTKSCASLTLDPEMTDAGYYVFASFEAPVNFPTIPGASPYPITIKAHNVRGTTSKNFNLLPPPITLVHGVWSSKSAWENELSSTSGGNTPSFKNQLTNLGYSVHLVDHSDIASSAGSFDPNINSPVIERFIEQGVNQVRKQFRDSGVAISQVDVIGHSMGGLISRARIKYSQDPYLNILNFGKGDIHKLITIGSPHFGTNIANTLIENKCNLKTICKDVAAFTLCDSYSLEGTMSFFGRPLGDAVYGFQTSSPSLDGLGISDVKSHAIIGVAPTVSGTELNLDLLMGEYSIPDDIDTIHGGDLLHDTIVPLESQKGGMDNNAWSSVTNIVHANTDNFRPINDINETNSQEVFDVVKSLLSTSVNSSIFSSFPSIPAGGEYIAPAACPVQKAASKGLSVELSHLPVTEQVVHPDSVVNIEFSITNGVPVTGLMLSIQGEMIDVVGTSVFQHSFTVPSNVSGKIDIYGETYGGAVENYSFETSVIVVPDDILNSITVNPTTLDFTVTGRTLPITVVGNYSSGVQIDISDSLIGTTYTTLSGNNNIVSIDSNGVALSIGSGIDSIIIENSGINISIPVSVNLSEFIFKDGFD
ncbi:MAG: PQQ-binding-like beta-propeller repeat protein [Pseudomonadota bacterium]